MAAGVPHKPVFAACRVNLNFFRRYIMEFSAIDTIWVLLGAAMVFFMQAGFAMVETGFTRAKNAGNIIMKNLMDFAIGTPTYWIIGFGIMFGTGTAFAGVFDPFVQNDYSALGLSVGTPTFLIFQTVFAATSATIVSGAMAERTKFSSYCIYSFVISAIIYPISGHWIWGGGWLAQLGFHDFAGSTAVHMVGGVAALIGAKMLGPRIGKFDKNGKPKAIPGHSLTLGALGVFILWFCWFGFNGTSTLGMEGQEIAAGNIFVTTNLAAACATVAVMLITWIRYKKPDVSMTLNGSLAGLVAITAGCDAVTPAGAAIIGIIAGFAVVFGIEFIEKVCKIDDPVGAIGVHGICGALGTILTGVFATDEFLAGIGDAGMTRGAFIGTQALGVVSVIAWVAVTMTIIFFIIKKTIGLRVSKEEEIGGLDATEHNLPSAYADFAPVVPVPNGFAGATMPAPQAETVSDAVPVRHMPTELKSSDKKMTKLAIITNQSKFEALKSALDEIGVTGITVTQVLGRGVQKGRPEYYRGVAVDSVLLPKVKVEVIVSKVPVETVVDAVKKAIYTGHIGDGKIFIYDVENVIRVRTGEQGYDALQDADVE